MEGDVIVVILYAIIDPPSSKAATIFKPYSMTGMCLSGSRFTDPGWVQELSCQSEPRATEDFTIFQI